MGYKGTRVISVIVACPDIIYFIYLYNMYIYHCHHQSYWVSCIVMFAVNVLTIIKKEIMWLVIMVWQVYVVRSMYILTWRNPSFHVNLMIWTIVSMRTSNNNYNR